VILDNRRPAKEPVRHALEVVSYDDRSDKTVIVLKRSSTTEPVTRLEIETPDRDFNKVVTVWGSTDKENWKILGEEPIYDFSSRVNLRKTQIALSKNAYPYFQLAVDEGEEKGNSQEIRLRYDGMDFQR